MSPTYRRMNSLDGEEVEEMKNQHDYNHIYELCKNHMHAYVLAEMVDGTKVDGIVTGLDEEYVYFALPLDVAAETTQQSTPANRQFGGYGYGGYGGYGYPRPRFRRLILPLAALAALSILPWY